jgi:hypothetical protein
MANSRCNVEHPLTEEGRAGYKEAYAFSMRVVVVHQLLAREEPMFKRNPNDVEDDWQQITRGSEGR